MLEQKKIHELLSNYDTIVQKVDVFCNALNDKYSDEIVCRKGCSHCCRHLSVSIVEAVSIRLALERLEPSVKEEIVKACHEVSSEDECPLMHHQYCRLYDDRPIICRTHGLPVLVREENNEQVDVCPKNFTGTIKPHRNETLDLDQLNAMLSTVNRLFIQQCFGDEGVPERVLLSEAMTMEIDDV